MSGYEAFTTLPLVGTIQTDGGSRVVHISETYETDNRDDDSYFVATSSQMDMPVVFLFVADYERGGVLLQAAANRAPGGEGKTDGWYLGVHKSKEDDELYPDFVRVIIHKDRELAAVWTLADVDGQTLLQIKENPEDSGSVGSYLAVPPDSDRDETSAFVAVTEDSGAATPVKAVSEGSGGGTTGGYGGGSYAAAADEGTGYGETSYEQPEGEDGGYGGTSYEQPEGEDGGYGGTSYETPEGEGTGYGETSYETPEGEGYGGEGYGEGGYEAPSYE